MAIRQKICDGVELPNGTLKSSAVGPVPVVIARTHSGSLCGMVDRCLHMGAPLSCGRLDHKIIAEAGIVGRYAIDSSVNVLRCPWHGYEYDIETGRLITDPGRVARTVRVWEEDGEVFAEV